MVFTVFPAKNLEHLMTILCKSLAAFRRNLETHCFQSAFTTHINLAAESPSLLPEVGVI